MIPWLLCLSSLFSLALSQIDCDIRDPSCRERYNRKGSGNVRRKLLPARPGAKRLLEIVSSNIHIKPDVIRFPGCFTLEIRNVKVLDREEALGNSFFAKAEYQWWNVKDFSNLKCQNASNNGCGGYGNNCFYCDVCESLTELDEGRQVPADSLQQQLKGINCPKRAGFYTFRKEFCFNDWSAFDADGDCEMDFLNGDKGDYKGALSSLQQVGYFSAESLITWRSFMRTSNKASSKVS